MGEDAGLHYIAMEFVEGHTLDRLIEEATLRINPDRTQGETPQPDSTSSPVPGDPVEVASPNSRRYMVRVAELFAGAARALAAAHATGVVHRDIKPSNLILDPGGQLRILDFGLARASGMGRITHTGETIGTPRYMSPELINPRKTAPDHRTDVYSLGVSLYETLTLRPAFHGENAEELLLEVLTQEPARPRTANPAIPRDLETVVLRAMAKRPTDRYPDAAALAEDLQRFVEGLAPRARRMGPATRSFRWVGRHKMATTVGALVFALILSLLLWVKRDRQDENLHAYNQLMAWGQRYLAYQVGPDDAELSPTDVVQEASERFDQARAPVSGPARTLLLPGHLPSGAGQSRRGPRRSGTFPGRGSGLSRGPRGAGRPPSQGRRRGGGPPDCHGHAHGAGRPATGGPLLRGPGATLRRRGQKRVPAVHPTPWMRGSRIPT